MIFFFRKKNLIFCCFALLVCLFLPIEAASNHKIDVKQDLNVVSLDRAWKGALSAAENRPLTTSKIKETSFKASLWFETVKNYYQIQFYEEALKKAKETKKHFDQAISKAESGFEEDDENVTQFVITKLKLGSAAMKDQVAGFSSRLEQAKVELGALTGKDFFDPLVKVEKPLRAASFSYKSWESFLEKKPDFFNKRRGRGGNADISLFGDHKLEFKVRSRQAFIRVLEARKKMQTAREVNKSVRALMAMESSNYDLGLGNPVDLFESFLLHSRFINVSLESIYNFNLAVAEWRRVTGHLP